MTLISNSSAVRPHAGISGKRRTRRTRAVAARFSPRKTRVGTPRRKLSEEQPCTSGDIWLLERASRKNRPCKDNDVTQRCCRVWTHTVHHSAPKNKVASGETSSHTAASPARQTPWRKQGKEKSQ